MICQHCDNEVADNVEYCPYCGTKLTPLESDRSGKSFFGGKRRIKLPSPQEEESVSNNNNPHRGQYGLNNRIRSRIALVGAMVLLLLIALNLPIGIGTNDNAEVSSDTGKTRTPSALLGDTSSSAATDSSVVDSEDQESVPEAGDAADAEDQESAQEAAGAADAEAQEPAQEAGAVDSEAQEPAQETADAHDTDSQPIPADADSNEKEQGAPVITCDVHDLVLQVGESREVLISLGGSNLPGSRSITVTSLQGIVDWEWEDWVDGSSVKAIVTGLIEGDVQLELYFSDGDDKSEEPTKLASTYLHVKVIPNENNASSN